jgi:hypothetical protein
MTTAKLDKDKENFSHLFNGEIGLVVTAVSVYENMRDFVE